MISKLKEKRSQDLDFAFRVLLFLLELREGEVCFRISQSLLVIDPSKSSRIGINSSIPSCSTKKIISIISSVLDP